MANENFNPTPESQSFLDKKISRRQFIAASGAAVTAAALHRIPGAAETPVSKDASLPNAESLPKVELSLVAPSEVYEGPGNKEFDELSQEPLQPGAPIKATGKFGAFVQAEAEYTNINEEIVSGTGYVLAEACGELPPDVRELTVDEVPWATAVQAPVGSEYANLGPEQIMEHVGESYKVGDSDFKLDISLTAPSYEDPNQNHGILVSNPDTQGDANSLLAVVRDGESWTLWQINVPNQQYTNLTTFQEATPEEIKTTLRVNQEGTEVQVSYENIPDETIPLPNPFYDQNRYVDLFAASAGNSNLTIDKLSLQVPPSGQYIEE